MNNAADILKQGLGTCTNLQDYVTEALRYAKAPHELVSSINRDDWLYFNSYDQLTKKWTRFVATLNENASRFDLYKIYGGVEKRQVAEVPVTEVWPNSKLQKLGFPVKSTKAPSKPKPKVNTHKTPKKSTVSHKRATKKSKSSKKGSTAKHKGSKK